MELVAYHITCETCGSVWRIATGEDTAIAALEHCPVCQYDEEVEKKEGEKDGSNNI